MLSPTRWVLLEILCATLVSMRPTQSAVSMPPELACALRERQALGPVPQLADVVARTPPR
jgi:hypothetical protein